MHDDTIISAQVLLKPASGKPLDREAALTASRLEEFAPSAKAVTAVTLAFQALGFQVGPLVGISFSITAPPQTFERTFGVRVRPRAGGGLEWYDEAGQQGQELPLHALPRQVANEIEAVTFVPPPDFGPNDFA